MGLGLHIPLLIFTIMILSGDHHLLLFVRGLHIKCRKTPYALSKGVPPKSVPSQHNFPEKILHVARMIKLRQAQVLRITLDQPVPFGMPQFKTCAKTAMSPQRGEDILLAEFLSFAALQLHDQFAWLRWLTTTTSSTRFLKCGALRTSRRRWTSCVIGPCV